MLGKYVLCCLFLLTGGISSAFSQVRYAQVDAAAMSIPEEYTRSVDSLALYINRNFLGDEMKLRAVYVWMIHHLKYNVYTTFVSRDEVPDENKELARTLRSREGVCRQFAMLFKNVAQKMGIPAYTVPGYNKNGKVVLPEPHEWCAARIGSQWYLFDPTYGMGYIENYKFVSSPNTSFFKLSPGELISTHMPFDPLWQLLERPYSFPEFDNGIVDEQRRVPVFHVADSLAKYARQTHLQRMIAANARVLANGRANRLVEYFLQLTQANIQIARKGEVYGIYKQTVKLQNEAVDLINLFIQYRNSYFQPEKEEREVRHMVEEPEMMATQADSLIHTIREIPPQYETGIRNLRKSIMELAAKVFKQKLFVEKYYATKPSQRKSLFSEP